MPILEILSSNFELFNSSELVLAHSVPFLRGLRFVKKINAEAFMDAHRMRFPSSQHVIVFVFVLSLSSSLYLCLSLSFLLSFSSCKKRKNAGALVWMQRAWWPASKWAQLAARSAEFSMRRATSLHCSILHCCTTGGGVVGKVEQAVYSVKYE